MTQPQDPIPVLPPMPRLPRRRRRRSYLPFIVGTILIAVGALGAMVLAVQSRLHHMADQSFAQAEQRFQSGAFLKARQDYESFCSEYGRDARVHEARTAANLSKVAQSLDDELANPRNTIEALDQFARETRATPVLKARW